MRYHSLRFVSLLYKIGGIVGGLLTLIFFVIALVGGNTVQQLGFGVIGTLPYIAAFYILVAGMIGSITSYAFGAFIMLMIDVEQGIRNIGYAMNKREYPDDQDPVNPRPLASFPPLQYSKPSRKTGEDRQRPPGKWNLP